MFDRWQTKKIFVVGCGHSGTSLMIRLLGEHSKIYAIPKETSLFVKSGWAIIKWRLFVFGMSARRKGKSVWAEKTPRHIHRIEKILKFCPDAKFVAMTRDARDVGVSIRERGLSFEAGLERWIEDNKALLAAKALLPDRILIVSLEGLVADPRKTIGQVLSFLGLGEENLTDYHRHQEDWYSQTVITERPGSGEKANHERLRNWQINQPIFSTTKRHEREMEPGEGKIFEEYRERVKKISDQLGYAI